MTKGDGPLLYCPELLSHSARMVSSLATSACSRLIVPERYGPSFDR